MRSGYRRAAVSVPNS